MKEPDPSEGYPLALIRRSADTSRPTYTLAEMAQLVGVHQERVRYYCRLGLLGSAREPSDVELTFDNDALYELRRIEYYRRNHGYSRKTLRMICCLWQEIERLQAELRFLRGR